MHRSRPARTARRSLLPWHPSMARPYCPSVTPKSFRDTGLKNILEEASITDVGIFGAVSHMCIDATARASFDFGRWSATPALRTRGSAMASTSRPHRSTRGSWQRLPSPIPRSCQHQCCLLTELRLEGESKLTPPNCPIWLS
ncbi:isochorismatase family protein [Sphingomonas aurantiaca]|uniref:isochorismatase family protein n=1 Tax=Sphingomonas aurantiaca TaxID=185949 RepID=UPI003CC55240